MIGIIAIGFAVGIALSWFLGAPFALLALVIVLPAAKALEDDILRNK